VQPGAARPKVLLYLLLTMAPFAVIAPLIGPFLDRIRGGRRLLIALASATRAVICLLMADHLHSLFLFPLAFGALVCSKSQSIAKSSLVPAVVRDDSELVLANSRLALISVIAGLAGGVPAATILKTTSGAWVLRVAAVIFVCAAIAALGIPRSAERADEERAEDRAALQVPSIAIAGSAMALLRGVVGFLTFFAAFVLKRAHEPAWMYGALLAVSALGNGGGTLLAPQLRKRVREESILVGALLLPGVVMIFLARSYGRTALLGAGFLIAAGAACGRLAFDSLVQRDAHDAARGRSFARFETRFQVVWVIGGVVAVAFPGGGRAGLFLVALVTLFGGLSYLGAIRRPGGVVLPPARDWRGRALRLFSRVRRPSEPGAPGVGPPGGIDDPPDGLPSSS
jgi:hypothetical protein